MQLRSIDPDQLDPVARYRLLVGTVVPRPIAWVSTLSDSGVGNLAPFSFFNGVCSSPLVLSICIGFRDPAKDTLANLRERGEAVVQLVPPGMIAECHQSGAAYPSDQDEAEAIGLDLVASELIKPMRLRAACVAFECTLLAEHLVGDGPTSLVLLEAKRVHIREDWLAEDGLPNPDLVRAPARLGNRAYLNDTAWDVVHEEKQKL